MTIRTILVPTAERPECVLALDKACALAVKLNANITGCHITPHAESITRRDSTEIEAARALFEKSAENHGLPLVTRRVAATRPRPTGSKCRARRSM